MCLPRILMLIRVYKIYILAVPNISKPEEERQRKKEKYAERVDSECICRQKPCTEPRPMFKMLASNEVYILK